MTRNDILESVDTLEIIEEYPDDKYLPSYLLIGAAGKTTLHVLTAVDVPGESI